MDIVAEIRKFVGKRNTNRLRCSGKIPAVIYSSNMSINICFDVGYVNSILGSFYNGTSLFKISVNTDVFLVLLKDFYKHPFKNTVLHFDFQKVEQNDVVNTKVFFKFIGEKNSIGIKQGGFLIKNKMHLNVRCLVSKIPDFITVDISNLNINTSLFLNDLIIPDFISVPALSKSCGKILIASLVGSRVLEQKVSEVKQK